MLGAIIGDVVGSRFEFRNTHRKDFTFLSGMCEFTDDSVMTCAVADALLQTAEDRSGLSEATVERMHTIGRCYPHCGYGGRFFDWMFSDDPQPYRSYGNGAAMRVSALAWAAETLEECKALSKAVTKITHDHPEGLKGAEATAVCTWLALHGADKQQILETIRRDYYPMKRTIDEMRPTYRFNETCQHTVPQALQAFMEGETYEDVIRIAVSLGGDSDTLAAIAGAVTEAYFGIPEDLRQAVLERFLDVQLSDIVTRFEARYGRKIAE